MEQKKHWIVTADSRRGSLYSCRRRDNGGLNLELVSAIENRHEGEHERERPTLSGGAERRGAVARSGARAAPHSIAAGQTEEEEHRRFARELADWITRAGNAADVPQTGTLNVFAGPRLLGLLRDEVGKNDGVSLREGDFSRLTPAELAAHPAVLGSLG
jgi:protein required for attachment to host cells